jgi:hypothetical protein
MTAVDTTAYPTIGDSGTAYLVVGQRFELVALGGTRGQPDPRLRNQWADPRVRWTNTSPGVVALDGPQEGATMTGVALARGSAVLWAELDGVREEVRNVDEERELWAGTRNEQFGPFGRVTKPAKAVTQRPVLFTIPVRLRQKFTLVVCEAGDLPPAESLEIHFRRLS